MDPRLLRYYNEELRHLREMGVEFAQAFPKIAARLGIEGLEVTDPYVERLLEGFAFLAGRIQLKLDAEFPRFTQRLLEILYPQLLAPIPSMLMARVEPQLGDAMLAGGATLPRGSVLVGRPGKGGSTACEFRTGHALELWPLELTQAEYFTHAAGLPAAALGLGGRHRAGLRLRLKATAGLDFSRIALADLRVHCNGVDDIAFRLHELVVGNGVGVIVLPAARADGRFETLDAGAIAPLGLADDEALLPIGMQGLGGIRLLQEYFAFPQRFLGFELRGLGEALRRLGGSEADLVILAGRADAALQQAVDASCVALHCVAAVNLVERRCDRIHIEPQNHDHHVVPDGTRPMDFEVHTIQQVDGYGVGVDSEVRFLPLYGDFHVEDHAHRAYYTLQREPRLLSAAQQREGTRSGYVGSEVYLTLVDTDEAPYPDGLRQIGVKALCTHRDLPLLMPVAGAAGDLALAGSAPVRGISVLKGPSRPLSSLREGNVAWKLINHLALNHLSLQDLSSEQGAAALRTMLRLHATSGDAAAQRQIDGLRSVRTVPVVRRLPLAGPIAFGRGVGIELEVEDLAFEGGSAFLLGSVLDCYFARHVSLNGFTQLTLRSPARGTIFAGRPTLGQRPVL
jgi:type VI secretion system protein ImpG